MPPQKKDKKKHYRGKQFTNFENDVKDDVQRRNRAGGDGGDSDSSSDGEDGPELDESDGPMIKGDNIINNQPGSGVIVKDVSKETVTTGEDGKGGEEKLAPGDTKPKKKKKDDEEEEQLFGGGRLNQGMNPGDATLAGSQLTRKQREEIEKNRKKAHYEKLHREGKTDEAKADLARLAKIRAEREEAKKKREEEERLKREEEGDKKSKEKAKKAYVDQLGGGESKKVGKKGKKDKKDKKKDSDSDRSDDEDTKKDSKKDKKEDKSSSNTSKSKDGKIEYNMFGQPVNLPTPGSNKSTAITRGTVPTGTSSAATKTGGRTHQDQQLGMYSEYITDSNKKTDEKKDNLVAGSIEACREEEDDFM